MDAVGYSRMMSDDEEGTLRTLAGHRQVIDEIIQSREGRIFNTGGDSVLAEFESPVEAVRCAVEIQAALKTRNTNLQKSKRMLFRIGINLGDVTVKDGDLLGDGVNVAARLESSAEPGGICVSSSVYEQTLGKLTLGFADLGELALKNITRPVHAYTVFEGEPSVRPLHGRKARAAKPSATVLIGFLVVVVLAALLWWQQQKPLPPPAPPAPDPEEVLWSEVRMSDNPAEFAAYLQQYPNGAHSELAKLRMAKLQAEEAQQRELQEALQKAQEAVRNAKDEVASVKARQQQARLEAELQRARLEAEKARVAMQAEKAKLEQLKQKQQQQEAAAAAAAVARSQPVVAAPSPEPKAPPGPRRYDGTWKVIFECHEYLGQPPFTSSVDGTISDGSLDIERGNPGYRGYISASGRLRDDDTLVIYGQRYSWKASRNVDVDFEGKFTGGSFTGSGTFGRRDCDLTMLRSE
jgi:class 3 adenylate cyclase